MKDSSWKTLAAAIRHGNTILVLGSEIADKTNGALDQVDALRAHLAASLASDGIVVTGDTLAAVAQQYEDESDGGAMGLRASAEDFYRETPVTTPEVYAKLAALPFRLILTSCQNDAVVQAFSDRGKKPITQRYHVRSDQRDNPEFPLLLSPETPVVYHLFGHSREPASLVLSENDILDFLIAIVKERPALPNSLQSVLKRRGQNFLFIGFGVKQWYLRVLLKVFVRVLELNHKGSAIAEPLEALPAPDRQQTVLFYRRGTKIEVADTALGSFVDELAKRVEDGGGYTGPTTQVARPRVFICHASENAALAARVFAALQLANFDPWLDKEALRPGEPWDARIVDELDSSDYVVVLHTPALAHKTDSYVNKEIALAKERALRVRGVFLIPLCTDDLADEDRIPELKSEHDAQLRLAHVELDTAALASSMRRDYQRRNR